MKTAVSTCHKPRSKGLYIMIWLAVGLLMILPRAMADNIISDDFSSYSGNFQVLDNFESLSGWVNNTNATISLAAAPIIAYNQSMLITLPNAGLVNKSLSNVNFTKFQVMKLWWRSDKPKTDGFNVRLYDNGTGIVTYNVSSNTNITTRKIFEINGSGFGIPPQTITANFNWQNVTKVSIGEANHNTFPIVVYVDDLRLANNIGDFGTNWTVPLEDDGRRGDCSLVNYSATDQKVFCQTYQNTSLLAQTAFVYWNKNFANAELSFTVQDYSNDSDNFHTLWSFSRMNWYGSHDFMDGYLVFARNNLTGNATDNSIAAKRRYNGTGFGSPVDVELASNSFNYLNPRNYTIRFINNNVKVYINGQLATNTWDPNISLLSTGTLGFRSPDNQIIGSFASVRLYNFSALTYRINQTSTYIRNDSGVIVDTDSIGNYTNGFLVNNLTVLVTIQTENITNPRLFNATLTSGTTINNNGGNLTIPIAGTLGIRST